MYGLKALLLLSLLFLSMPIQANDRTGHFNVGIGYYSLQIYDEEWGYDSDRLNGVALSALYAIKNWVALRGTYYQLNTGDFDNTDTDGYEVMVFFGRGLVEPGGKWYLGAGGFDETWHDQFASHQFDGLQLGAGFGYNWKHVALDMLLVFRDPSDYDAYLGRPNAEISTAGSLSILLSARF